MYAQVDSLIGVLDGEREREKERELAFVSKWKRRESRGNVRGYVRRASACICIVHAVG